MSDIWGWLDDKLGTLKSAALSDYEGLLITKEVREFMINFPSKFIAICNGVGSEIGFWGKLTYRLIPNTIWFLNITKASNLHDVGYTVPSVFITTTEALVYKDLVDAQFYSNLIILIERAGGWLENRRKKRAYAYYLTLKNCGKESFLAGKTILSEVKV